MIDYRLCSCMTRIIPDLCHLTLFKFNLELITLGKQVCTGTLPLINATDNHQFN